MFFLFVILFSLCLFSQFEETVIISASPYKTSFEELKNHTEVISENDLREKESLEEIFRFSSSFNILRSGSPGKVSSFFLRGSESNHTLLLLEGMPLNDPYFGNIYLSEYLSKSFSRAEILKGPYSSIYGSEALGGVVSLFLKKEEKANFSIGIGNYGYEDLNFYYGKNRFIFQFSKHREDGRMENDGWDENQTHFYFDGENLNAFIFARKGKIEIPFNGQILTPLRNQKTEDYIFSLPFEKKFLNGWAIDGFTGILRSNFYFEDPDDNWGYTWGKTKSQRIFGNLKFYKTFNETDIAFGLEAKEEKVWDKNVYGENLNGENFENGALFFQGKKRFKNFIIQAGGRYDFSSNFGNSLNPKLGIFIPFKSLNFYLQTGKGFKAPSIGELYFPYSGNKDLKEEELISIETGFSISNITLNFFKNKFKNLIDFEYSSYQFKNIGKAKTEGIEINYKNSFLNLNLAYLGTKDLNTGNELLRRPSFSGNFILIKNFKNYSFSFSTFFIGKRWDVNEYFERVKMKEFAREDFSLNMNFKKWFNIRFRIENLFNSSYEEVYGYKAPGRRIVLNFEKNFDI